MRLNSITGALLVRFCEVFELAWNLSDYFEYMVKFFSATTPGIEQLDENEKWLLVHDISLSFVFMLIRNDSFRMFPENIGEAKVSCLRYIAQ